jgi:hypothetical protein
MKALLPTILLLLAWASAVSAQDEDTLPVGAVAERSVTGSALVETFRQVGEYRVWRFFAKQTTFGMLTSTVKERTEVDGEECLALEETLQIDYSKIGTDRQVEVTGRTYVSTTGRYLGSKMEIGSGETVEQMELTRKGTSLEGFFTRAGTENDLSLPYEQGSYFWEADLVDQLEIFLAMQDLEIGSVIDDSIWMPQTLLKSRISGHVAYFMWQEIYKGKIDSVFIIRLTQPSNYQLYFTPDKRLLRVDMLDQGIRVYQDLVRVPADAGGSSGATTGSHLSARNLLLKLPHYLAFLVIAAVAILMVSRRTFKWSGAYLALGLGLVLYLIIPLLVNRLLVTIAGSWLRSGSIDPGSIYLIGSVPPLLLGLVQVGLLIGGLALAIAWLKAKEYRQVALGALVGAGMGIAEAVYLSGLDVTFLFDFALVERACFIFLHVFSGAIVGWSWRQGGARLGLAAIVIVLVNGLTRYLPLLVRGGMIDVEATHFVMILWVLAFVVVSLIVLKRRVRVSDTDVGGSS